MADNIKTRIVKCNGCPFLIRVAHQQIEITDKPSKPKAAVCIYYAQTFAVIDQEKIIANFCKLQDIFITKTDTTRPEIFRVEEDA